MSVLVHFSFIVPVGILMGYVFLGNRLNIYFGFFVVATFFSELDLDFFNSIVEAYAPEILQERTRGYRSEAVIEAREERVVEVNWYVEWRGRLFNWAMAGYAILLYIVARKRIRENQGMLSLFCISLVIYGVASVLSSLPSGGRFIVIAHLCLLAFLVLYVQNFLDERALRFYTFIVLPALLLYILVGVRVGLYSISATSVLGNPVVAFFILGENLSLNDVMRMIL
jgi:hypothetical protein